VVAPIIEQERRKRVGIQNGFGRVVRTVLLVLLPLLLIRPALGIEPTIIYESATLGPIGQAGGYAIDGTQFIGSRFYLSEQREITAIGGHLTEWGGGNLFGAILSLSSINDLPAGSPFIAGQVKASTVFDAPFPSTDFRTPLSVTLPAGFYVVVFGSDELGASGGTGVMPETGQVKIGQPTFIVWNGIGWYDTIADPPPRFVVEGIVGYCAADGDCYDSYISRVTVGSIDNSTGCQIYSDHTALSTTVVIGSGYPITVVNGYPFYEDDECTVWVDWNQDLDFDDDDERIAMAGSPGEGPYTATITPPVLALPGDTRMRIRLWAFDPESPCGGTIGEVEDYTITVSDEVPKYGGGSGTLGDPYLIYTAEQMQAIGTEPNDWNAHFKLMANINLGGYTGSSFNMIGGSGHPDPDPMFHGVFDGNWHTISNFTYSDSAPYIGIFGGVGHHGRVKNLGLVSPSVHGLNNYVGALAAKLKQAYITNCWVEGGSVEGGDYVGALVGHSYLSGILNCYGNTSVTGGSRIGGIVGKVENSGVYACYARGSVTATGTAGGLAGYILFGSINQCYSTGSVSGSPAGGLVGYLSLSGYVYDSFWDTTTSGQASSPGGTGLPTGQMQDMNTFLDAGWDFVGETENGPNDDWASPSPPPGYPILWWQLSPWPSLPSFAGGSGTPEDPYLIATAEQLNSIGHNSRLVEKHYKLIDDIDLTDVNFSPIGDRPYPFTGTFEGDNHTLSNFTFFGIIVKQDSIGIFGVIDDPNAEVRNVRLVRPDVSAWFALGVGSLAGGMLDGTISNCHVEDANVWSIMGWTGGLIGGNVGVISNCSSTGRVYSRDYGAGGLAGTSEIFSIISDSYSTASASGDRSVGGLVGSLLLASIMDSYAAGTVSGVTDAIGGFAGYNHRSDVINCYSCSTVSGPNDTGAFAGINDRGSYTACFWDSNVCDPLPGIGSGAEPNVVGESTTNMQKAVTFTGAGWDFVTPVWEICEGTNYPKLSWQVPYLGDFRCPDGVDWGDFSAFAEHWGRNDCGPVNDYCDRTDTDQDGDVDWRDFRNLALHWLEEVGP
jgi:hypothetical protein